MVPTAVWKAAGISNDEIASPNSDEAIWATLDQLCLPTFYFDIENLFFMFDSPEEKTHS